MNQKRQLQVIYKPNTIKRLVTQEQHKFNVYINCIEILLEPNLYTYTTYCTVNNISNRCNLCCRNFHPAKFIVLPREEVANANCLPARTPFVKYE